jgi:hypothetical protein
MRAVHVLFNAIYACSSLRKDRAKLSVFPCSFDSYLQKIDSYFLNSKFLSIFRRKCSKKFFNRTNIFTVIDKKKITS